MPNELEETIKRLFHAALEVESSKRAEFLEGAFTLDPSIRKEVESLFDAHDEENSFLDQPPLGEKEPLEDESVTWVREDNGAVGERLPHTPADYIGPYRILREIGRGGMGVVYEAEQQHPRRSVALKVIRGERYLDEYHVRLFQREAQALARLKHPGIAGIYEAGRTEDGQHFFAMELVSGEPLTEYLRKRPDLLWKAALETRLQIFEKICNAVNYAHQRGVIHRDLKPSNIFVSEEPGSRSGATGALAPQVKILDFGLARITDPELPDVTSMTALGRVQGTLPYMSPEQARAVPEEIDLRSDIYSLGVILYEMVTGRKPYEVQPTAPLEALRIICQETPKRPSQALMEMAGAASRPLDRDLETIILKALEKEPSERYQSAQALADDIECYRSNRPILAHPPSTMYQLQKLVSRHKVGVGFGVALLSLVIGFAVVATVQSTLIARERDRADQRRNQAEGLISFMLGDLREKLEPVGQLEILDDVGDQALEYFTAVSPDQLSDEELFRQSQALHQIGDVRLTQGNLSAARKVLEESLALTEKLVARNPDNAEWNKSLGIIHDLLGLVLFEQGDLEGAIQHHRARLAFSEEFASREPQNSEWQLAILECHASIGYVMAAQGDKEGGLEEYLLALEIGRALMEGDPTSLEWQYQLAYTHSMVGTGLMSMGRLEESNEHYQANLEILQMLNENDATHTGWRYQLALAHYYLGTLMEKMGRLDEALVHYGNDLEIERELAAHDPDNPSWQRDEAIANVRFGGILTEQGEGARAEVYYQDAFEILERLVQASPTNIHLRDFAKVHQRLGRLRLELGERDEAHRLSRTALDLLESIEARTSDDGTIKEGLSQTLILLGRIQFAEGRKQDARASWLDALEVIESLSGYSDDMTSLDTWVRALLYLDRVDEAKPAIERMTSNGYGLPSFLELCREKGAMP